MTEQQSPALHLVVLLAIDQIQREIFHYRHFNGNCILAVIHCGGINSAGIP